MRYGVQTESRVINSSAARNFPFKTPSSLVRASLCPSNEVRIRSGPTKTSSLPELSRYSNSVRRASLTASSLAFFLPSLFSVQKRHRLQPPLINFDSSDLQSPVVSVRHEKGRVSSTDDISDVPRNIRRTSFVMSGST